MNKLILHGRPIIYFDVQNKQHREWFAEFNKTYSWKHCPVRFMVPEVGDLITMIRQQLIEFYVKKEFGNSFTNYVLENDV